MSSARAYLPSDGYLDPSQLCYSLANGARAKGVQVHPHTRVIGIDTERGRVTRVRTDKGDIDCEVVVDCGGMFAAEIARLVDVRVPLVPMSHQYVVTEPLLPPGSDRRCRRCGTRTCSSTGARRSTGWSWAATSGDPAPWTADHRTYDAIPADFNGRLLPEDWDRFEEITANSQVRVPAMADVGLRKVINGPEAFTPDNEFVLGETDVDGFFVAAGFCAHGIAGAGGIGKVMAEWIVSGDPGMDLWHMDVRRFGRQYRSPSYTLKRTLETYETYYDIVYPGHEREAGRPLRTRAGLRVAPRSTARPSARRPAGSGSTTTRSTRPRATRRSGRAAGPVGSGRRRSASSTGRPARRPRCSTSRPSPSCW